MIVISFDIGIKNLSFCVLDVTKEEGTDTFEATAEASLKALRVATKTLTRSSNVGLKKRRKLDCNAAVNIERDALDDAVDPRHTEDVMARHEAIVAQCGVAREEARQQFCHLQRGQSPVSKILLWKNVDLSRGERTKSVTVACSRLCESLADVTRRVADHHVLSTQPVPVTVLIESQMNGTMRALSHQIQMYFTTLEHHGVYKERMSFHTRIVSPRTKLAFFGNADFDVFWDGSKQPTRSYAENKKQAERKTRSLVPEELTEASQGLKKCDDLCDAYLQAIAYLQVDAVAKLKRYCVQIKKRMEKLHEPLH